MSQWQLCAKTYAIASLVKAGLDHGRMQIIRISHVKKMLPLLFLLFFTLLPTPVIATSANATGSSQSHDSIKVELTVFIGIPVSVDSSYSNREET